MKVIRLIYLVVAGTFIAVANSGCAITGDRLASVVLPDVHEAHNIQIHVRRLVTIRNGEWITGIEGYAENVGDYGIRNISLAFPLYKSNGSVLTEALANLLTGIGPGDIWNFRAVPLQMGSTSEIVEVGEARVLWYTKAKK